MTDAPCWKCQDHRENLRRYVHRYLARHPRIREIVVVKVCGWCGYVNQLMGRVRHG